MTDPAHTPTSTLAEHIRLRTSTLVPPATRRSGGLTDNQYCGQVIGAGLLAVMPILEADQEKLFHSPTALAAWTMAIYLKVAAEAQHLDLNCYSIVHSTLDHIWNWTEEDQGLAEWVRRIEQTRSQTAPFLESVPKDQTDILKTAVFSLFVPVGAGVARAGAELVLSWSQQFLNRSSR